MGGNFEHITHYKDGSRLVELFNTWEELSEFVAKRTDELNQTPDISIKYCEFGAI